MSKHAPIALFAYNRPDHFTATVEALKKNPGASESQLYIFSDGPKPGAEQAVEQVRSCAATIDGFRSVQVIESDRNQGLATSIIKGVTDILKDFESVIVLEDDIVTRPTFLNFMNAALHKYKEVEEVISIHGYCYPTKTELPENFFLRGADCWGWATWRRGWNLFQPDGSILLRTLQKENLLHTFDLDGAYQYSQMLKDQISGKNQSWAIRWHASAFLNNKLTLYPGRSLVKNIGLDGSGTHCAESADDVWNRETNKTVQVHDIEIVESQVARQAFSEFLAQTGNKPNGKLWSLAKKLKRKLLGSELRFIGPFATWKEALTSSSGYDTGIILDKVKLAMKDVVDGKAVYEQDTFAMKADKPHDLLVKILRVAGKQYQNKVTLLDFGGSLGGLYFRCKNHLRDLKLDWNIVEQEHFVTAGKEFNFNEPLHFFRTIDELTQTKTPNVGLFISSLQYLENPYDILGDVMALKPSHIIIDRSPFLAGREDLISVQKVPRQIYKASYPCWLFSEEKIKEFIENEYELVHEETAPEGSFNCGAHRMTFKSLAWQRKLS